MLYFLTEMALNVVLELRKVNSCKTLTFFLEIEVDCSSFYR
jgi:hypothetical protein